MGGNAVRLEPALQSALLAAIPELRAYAYVLTGSKDRVDDLVQDTLVRGITNIRSFTPGTNLPAWLTTILRHQFLNEWRRRGRSVEDPGAVLAGRLTTQPAQDGHLRIGELQRALAALPPDQREAVILVGGQGLSYEEVAEICECPVGTVKSRVCRARAQLAELMAIESADDLGPDPTITAALGGNDLRWAA